jgi:hypothetical protein
LQESESSTAVLFPGILASAGGLIGLLIGWRVGGRQRQIALLYGTLALLAFWLSLGPSGGLYTIGYLANPAFTFMREPSRFGMLVSLSLSVTASIALAAFLRRMTMPAVVAAGLCLVAAAEHVSPLRFTEPPPIAPVYRVLAREPFGAVLELPLYSQRHTFSRTRYMLSSTAHWKPLVNGYSGFTPPAFTKRAESLRRFPDDAAFAEMAALGVSHFVVHFARYREPRRLEIAATLETRGDCQRLLTGPSGETLYLWKRAP